MKKVFLILGVVLVTSLSIDNVNALQNLQTIDDDDTCGIKACPGGSQKCCTDPNGSTWYRHP